jgi:hypothetical protein
MIVCCIEHVAALKCGDTIIKNTNSGQHQCTKKELKNVDEHDSDSTSISSNHHDDGHNSDSSGNGNNPVVYRFKVVKRASLSSIIAAYTYGEVRTFSNQS